MTGCKTERIRTRERAIDLARQAPPPGVTPDAAAAEVQDVLDSIGDTCPKCAPD